MVDIEEFLIENNKLLTESKSKLNSLGNSLKVSTVNDELVLLREQTKREDFWNNMDEANKIFAKIKQLEQKVNDFDSINVLLNQLKDALEVLQEAKKENDEELLNSLIQDTENIVKNINHSLELLETKTLFSGKYDKSNCIITMHPGAGGTEAHDWVDMLYRMYTRWCEQNGFIVKELDFLAGAEAGIKSVTFSVEGEYAYGYLKSEMGVHRLVRISPFDSGGRRHTSFASCEVLPEIKNDNEIVINNDDLRVDTYRASGAGGQHINKTSSAVRITHIPTGIVVQCQNERSQQMNRETCMKMLTSKLIQLKEENNKDTIDELKGIQMQIAWGSQIRSYVFCPYTMVKDHRTNYEVGNVQKVMDGDLTDFMIAYLKNLH